MAIVAEKRGRPRYVADYTQRTDLSRPYYDEFYKACSTFTYREMVALSRMLGFSLRTIYRWRNNEDFPRNIGTALVVIDWNKQGKPIKLETRARIARRDTMW